MTTLIEKLQAAETGSPELSEMNERGLKCDYCGKPAPYRVGSSKSCGRHLVALLKIETPVSGYTVRITRVIPW